MEQHKISELIEKINNIINPLSNIKTRVFGLSSDGIFIVESLIDEVNKRVNEIYSLIDLHLVDNSSVEKSKTKAQIIIDEYKKAYSDLYNASVEVQRVGSRYKIIFSDGWKSTTAFTTNKLKLMTEELKERKSKIQ